MGLGSAAKWGWDKTKSGTASAVKLGWDKTKSGTKKAISKSGEGIANNWNYAIDNVKNAETPNIVLFFLIAWAIHLYDGFIISFRRTGQDFWLMFSLYVAFTLAGIFIIYRTRFVSSDSARIAAISFVAFLIPYILGYLKQSWLTAAVLAVPVWPIYLFLNPAGSSLLEGIGRWYLAIVIILGLYAFLTSMAIGLSPLAASSGVDTSKATEVLRTFFVDNTKKLAESVVKFPQKVGKRLNQSLGMDYFTGRVENNKDEPLGVYLEDLRATEQVFYEGNPVVVWATIRGKTFEGDIMVENSCFAEGREESKWGETYPASLSLFYDESSTLECSFDKGLSKGTHGVVFQSTFGFSTWGYMAYTFVDRDTSRAYYSQKKNINIELDIPRRAEPIYTSGPAGIGMNSPDMPIVVNPDSNRLPSFGVTLMNLWPQGNIETIKSLEVRIPEELVFESCFPSFEENLFRNEEDFNIYTFNLDLQEGQFFTTVTCRMLLDNPTDFLGANLKVTKTFAVKAEYLYTLKEKVNVRVDRLS